MRLPNFTNLSRFASKALNTRGSLNVNPDEAKRIALEYQMLLAHLAQLQDEVIALKSSNTVEIEVEGPEF